QGVGLADRPRLRHARRRQGPGPADAAPPGAAAARGRARGGHRRRDPGRGPGDGADPAMITWRPAALVLLGALALAIFGGVTEGATPPALTGASGSGWIWPAAGGLVLLVLLLSIVDILLAASPRDVTVTRDGDQSIWLGETATVRLTVHNGSVRPFDGEVRDAWVP